MAASYSATDLVDAKTAALILGVKIQTLYAYVSRGLIRAQPNRGNKPSLYLRRDVEALRTSSRSRGLSVDGSESVVRWGTGTTLPTAITSVDAHGPRYRGRLATSLAEMHCSYEDCVELLWTGVQPTAPMVWHPAHVPDSFFRLAASITPGLKAANSRQLLALLISGYAASVGKNPESMLGAPILAGRQLLQILAPSLGLLLTRPRYAPSRKAESIASIIAESAGASSNQEVIDALNACLVLSADHEMAPSTFAARVAASAGADIFSCVGSGLGTFEGPTTGLGFDEPERLLRVAHSPKDYVATLKEYRRRKQAVLGYDHPLYPTGDPRARYLIALAGGFNIRTPASRLILNCIIAATEELGLAPSLAIGFVAICSALNLPPQSPGALFAIGRVSGWIAHVLEQRLAGALMRPRIRYIGRQAPDTAAER